MQVSRKEGSKVATTWGILRLGKGSGKLGFNLLKESLVWYINIYFDIFILHLFLYYTIISYLILIAFKCVKLSTIPAAFRFS